jgi:DNA-binding NarL/FixJ family response regulator
MGRVVALVDDLIFQSKLRETARQVGVEVAFVLDGEQLAAEAQRDDTKLVVVDLNARAGAIAALEKLRTEGVARPTVGFFSHVQTELAERARAAGCAEVLPRSKFTAQLAEILARAKD